MFEHTDRHYSYNAKDIILKLKREIKKNYSMYNSLFKSDVDIYTQLQFYEDEVYCDTVTSEMLILSLCNYFNVEIVIVESYFGETFSGAAMIKQVVVPNCPTDESVPQRTLYLFRTSNHYQSLVPNGEYI